MRLSQRMPTRGFDEADTEQTIELETVPAAASSEEVGGSPGADVAPPATVTPAAAAPPTSEASRYSLAVGRDRSKRAEFFQHRCTGCSEALRPGSRHRRAAAVRRDQDHSTQVVIHWWTARSTRSPSAS